MESPVTGASLARVAGRRRIALLGRIEVTSYLVLLYAGCVLGVLAGAAVAASEGLDPARFALAATLLLVPAFAGARLLFVLQHLALFRVEPARAWRRAEGGSSLYGGLLLAVAVSVPALALANLPFWSFWDAASVTMLVGLVPTRFGCVMNGCCGGHAKSGPLAYPQLLEAAWAGIVLAGALALRGAARPGEVFAGVVAAYAAGRLVLEPTRHPSGRSRVNVIVSIALLVAGFALLLAGGPG
ncbi:MAG: prolipoprotein diacylglyceryl transferase family protein [Thermoleophilaceae bacterium]